MFVHVTGIDGCGQAFEDMGIPAEMCLAHDLEGRYLPYLQEHFARMGMDRMSIFDAVKVGSVVGDLLRVPLSRLRALAPIDGIVSGPPCPPWAGQGNKGSLKDPRAKVYLRLLEWTIYLIKMGGLLFVLLENVIGIKQVRGGKTPIIEHFIGILEKLCPEFWWGMCTLGARDYTCSQTGARVFLKGRLLPTSQNE